MHSKRLLSVIVFVSCVHLIYGQLSDVSRSYESEAQLDYVYHNHEEMTNYLRWVTRLHSRRCLCSLLMKFNFRFLCKCFYQIFKDKQRSGIPILRLCTQLVSDTTPIQNSPLHLSSPSATETFLLINFRPLCHSDREIRSRPWLVGDGGEFNKC